MEAQLHPQNDPGTFNCSISRTCLSTVHAPGPAGWILCQAALDISHDSANICPVHDNANMPVCKQLQHDFLRFHFHSKCQPRGGKDGKSDKQPCLRMPGCILVYTHSFRARKILVSTVTLSRCQEERAPAWLFV